ncbi:hypothetical protein PRVXT_001546 [Proteinivorax tanatarense]|uniref:DUF4203 domain-containing protein n=1 Tax=Proteinivorax tanatarense TaxID=1260629 RepID=A0AAU7VHE7_9FIRM
MTQVLAFVTFLFAANQCFRGFKVFKFWVGVIGFFSFGFISMVPIWVGTGEFGIAIFFSILLGILGAILSYKLYLAGVFILCGTLGFLLGGLLTQTMVLAILMAIVFGVMSVIFTKPVIIISTSIAGGLLAGNSFFVMLGINMEAHYSIFLGITFSIGGYFYQTSKTKPVSISVNDQEEGKELSRDTTQNMDENNKENKTNLVDEWKPKIVSATNSYLKSITKVFKEALIKIRTKALKYIKDCPVCEARINDLNSSCESCGQKFTWNEILKQLPKSLNKNISIKHKLIGSTTIVSVIAIFLVYQVLIGANNPERFIEETEKAILNSDVQWLSEVISPADSRMKIEDSHIKGLLKYFDKHPSAYGSFIQSLYDQAKLFDNGENNGHFVEDNLFTLKSKKGLLKRDYVLVPKSNYITLETNYEGVEIYFGEELLVTSDQEYFTQEFGPFMPGEYNITAKLEGEYTTLATESIILLMDPSVDKHHMDLSLYGKYTTVWADYDNVDIIINGDSSTKNIGDQIGPLKYDGSTKVEGVIELPWGKVESEVYPITKNYVNLEFEPIDEKIEESAVEMANEFILSYYDAYNESDKSLVENTTQQLATNIENDIEDWWNRYDSATLELIEATYEIDSISSSFHRNKADYFFSVSALVEYVQATEEEDWLGDLDKRESEILEHYELNFKYCYDKQDWEITGYSSYEVIHSRNIFSDSRTVKIEF